MKISLIIADLHLKWAEAEKIINNVGADEVIFLGDFFDDFNDDPDIVGEMADWLMHSVTIPNRIHLFGNHDVHYAFPEDFWRCSGYSQWKHFLIRDRFYGKKIWQKFKFYHVLDGKFLLSHAGLHSRYLPKNIAEKHGDRPRFLKQVTNFLDDEIIKGHRNESWIFHAGRARGGFLPVGGLTWCDFREFHPIKGLNQIVGHTAQGFGFPSWCNMDQNEKVNYYPHGIGKLPKMNFDDVNCSFNICLDVCGNMHWATWDGTELKIFNYTNNL